MKRSLQWLVAPLVAALLVPALVGEGVQAAQQGESQAAGPRAGGPGGAAGPVDLPPNFVALCRYSHTKSDDPIVLPGRPGASHSHDFFGNLTTNAYSDYDSLRAGGTSCLTPQDKSGYWVPSLLRNGQRIDPVGLKVYYRAGFGVDETRVVPFPAGFRVVAGDSHATAPQRGITRWACGPGLESDDEPVNCPADQPLDLHVRFPNCWDGVNTDSADHHSHMAYSVRGACPAGYPKNVPQLTAIVHYPISGDPSGLSLASGGVYSGHADFFNAWDQDFLAAKVRDCLNAAVHCGPRPNAPNGPVGPGRPARPN